MNSALSSPWLHQPCPFLFEQTQVHTILSPEPCTRLYSSHTKDLNVNTALPLCVSVCAGAGIDPPKGSLILILSLYISLYCYLFSCLPSLLSRHSLRAHLYHIQRYVFYMHYLIWHYTLRGTHFINPIVKSQLWLKRVAAPWEHFQGIAQDCKLWRPEVISAESNWKDRESLWLPEALRGPESCVWILDDKRF